MVTVNSAMYGGESCSEALESADQSACDDPALTDRRRRRMRKARAVGVDIEDDDYDGDDDDDIRHNNSPTGPRTGRRAQPPSARHHFGTTM